MVASAMLAPRRQRRCIILNQRRRIPRSLSSRRRRMMSPPSTKNAYATTQPRSAATSSTAAASSCQKATRAGRADALKCSACGCRRSFHRRADGGNSCYHGRTSRLPRLLPHPPTHRKPPFHSGGGLSSCPSPAGMLPPPGYVLSINDLSTGSGGATTESSSDERIYSSAAPAATVLRKRFRTKFTEEQKQRMLAFAQKVGWRFQRQGDSMLHQFCAEIGVRRHVFKVWMHNNKRGTTRKQPPPPPSSPAKQEQLLFVLQHH